MGLVWKVTEPDDAAPRCPPARRARSPPSRSPRLVACKRVITEPLAPAIAAARERENAAFVELLGGPANLEALAAFAEGREADFTSLPPGW